MIDEITFLVSYLSVILVKVSYKIKGDHMKNNDLMKTILQNILQYADIGIHVIDKNGKNILYNDVMAKLEGLEKHTVINKQLLDIFPTLNEDTSTLLNVLKTGRPIINKAQTYLNYKGQKITTVNTTIPLIDNGEKLGALEIAKNVTQIKELSEKLIDLKNELSKGQESINNYIKKHYTFKDIIGTNNKIRKAIEIARRASNSSSNVLIYGETGTGKELFAQSIHFEGIRKNKPFIAQNCAAIPESLLEGILFGTEKGGFTGAKDRPGLFEQANGGTLLLDEINSMGLSLQAKLLRVLQEEYIRRVGGIKDIPVDVRIIATTNEDPYEAVERGRLRKDLFYRLNVIYIHLPLLKERKDDFFLLVDYFIKKYNEKLKKDVWMLSDDVMKKFKEYDWPGNVRELENVIEAAMNYILPEEHVLTMQHFPSHICHFSNKVKIYKEINMEKSLPEVLSTVEKKLIVKALKEENNNITRTAKKLGIKRQALQYKLRKYDIF